MGADYDKFFRQKASLEFDPRTPLEFLITTRGDNYYGCYYSPDDVPLAFQNTAAELTQCGHDSWKWSAEGDNAGKTMKVMDHWYYFEASFYDGR